MTTKDTWQKLIKKPRQSCYSGKTLQSIRTRSSAMNTSTIMLHINQQILTWSQSSLGSRAYLDVRRILSWKPEEIKSYKLSWKIAGDLPWEWTLPIILLLFQQHLRSHSEIHLEETICTSFHSQVTSRRSFLAKSEAISKYFWSFGILHLSNKGKKRYK